MKHKQNSFKLHGKIIYVVTSDGGWSIIIMNNNVVLDNYHNKGGHIHPNPDKHPEEIKIKHDTQKENIKIIEKHLKENKGLKLNKLIEELI
jgi:hypothetical protein